MGGVGSGRKPHKQAVDWTELQRLSASYLLKRMRRVNTPEAIKDKIAIDVAGKTIGKAVFNQTTNIQTAQTWEELLKAAGEINAAKAALDASGNQSNRLSGVAEEPSIVLSGSFGGVPDSVPSKVDGVSQGQ